MSGGEGPTLVGTWNSLALTDAASIRQGGASWSQCWAGEHWSWHSAIYELSALTQHSLGGLKMRDHRNTHTHTHTPV